jgi:hypothetical protein
MHRRQESYVRRERQYKVRIGELEAQLSDSRAKKSKQSALDASMDRIRQLHRSILDSVGQVQDRTAKILQEQEKDLLRAFRARLYSVQEELESEKNKTDDGASAWIEKSKQLETEVEWTKELADRLDRLNQSLTRENQRLKTQFSTQESDREFLVKQLVGVKKDNVTLRNEYDALRRQLDQLTEESASGVGTGGSLSHHNHHSLMAASTSALPKVHAGMTAGSNGSRPNTAMGLHLGNNNGVSGGAMAASLAETDNRYKEIIKRLKRLLEVERRNLQQVRTSYKLELQNRTELETILKECIQDVRSERAAVSNQQTASQSVLPTVGGGGSSNGLKRPTSSMDGRLSASERQGLIDRLLEKERLLTLLTAKAFPIRHPASGKTKGDPLISGDTVSSDDLAKLLADVPSFSPTPSS